LKKITYILEKATLGLGDIPKDRNDLEAALVASPALNPHSSAVNNQQDDVEAPLLNSESHEVVSIEDANKFFISAVDEELEKIVKFYTKKEADVFQDLQKILTDISNAERQEETYLHSLWRDFPFMQPRQESSTAIEKKSATSALDSWDQKLSSPTIEPRSSVDISLPGFLPYLIWSSNSLKSHRNQFSKRVTNLFVILCELCDYVEINETGFSKVLKKYEKVLGAKIKGHYLAKIEQQYPFLQSTKDMLAEKIDILIHWYARIATDGKIQMAQADLKAHLREHIVWERNTIWRDMVEQERRRETIGFIPNQIGQDINQSKTVQMHICGFPCVIPRVIRTNVFVIVFSIIVLILICQSSILPTVPQNNCLGILVFATILWAFEALPLFVTSLIIPFLIVSLRVMIKDDERLDAKPAAKLIFSEMFGPVIMLLLGGFSLAAALSKHNIAKSMASVILEKAGTKPHAVLLANMFVSTFSSMWISNVAAPVLCFSLISPILRNLPHRSPYARCLVLGIAMAANVGGMASPIASPQNAIAMGIMNPAPSWAEWFAVALPICVLLDLAIWAVLLAIYRPKDLSIAPPELFSHHSGDRSFNAKQIYIMSVTVFTILLWCFESKIEPIVGDMGLIAIIPIVAFYGAGILTKDDWNSMLWSGIYC
jgi:phosphate transporter